ncbi:unnamed protein product [Staurois parvus]|uniref:Uncharacterized protein n=1 Tax=Staurois parvus TaxID=386267 RepID=A0ABN9HLZ2_9NEOB|nr:unnamed protein product [Staurois parvus]
MLQGCSPPQTGRSATGWRENGWRTHLVHYPRFIVRSERIIKIYSQRKHVSKKHRKMTMATTAGKVFSLSVRSNG